MTASARALVGVGIAAFVAFAVATAPASLVADRITGANPAIRLAGVSGSAWNGRAQQVQYGSVAVGTLHWRVVGRRLFTAHGAARFTLSGPEAQLAFNAQRALFGRSASVVDAVGSLPLALLAEMSGARGPLDARVELEQVAFTVDGTEVDHASGRVRLRDAVALVPRRHALGNYLLELSAVDGWLVATVVEADGALEITGLLRLRGDGRWEMDARARATQADSGLALVLQLLGEPDADGFRPVHLSGTL